MCVKPPYVTLTVPSALPVVVDLNAPLPPIVEPAVGSNQIVSPSKLTPTPLVSSSNVGPNLTSNVLEVGDSHSRPTPGVKSPFDLIRPSVSTKIVLLSIGT